MSLAPPPTPPTAPNGRRLLRLEARNAETAIERKPPWIRTRARMGPEYTQLRQLVADAGLHTVCQEAGCPRSIPDGRRLSTGTSPGGWPKRSPRCNCDTRR
jgi:hypothetical protein